MKCDALTAERIGAAWLHGALAPAGDFGRRAQDAAPPFGPGDEAVARRRCAQIVDLAARLDPDGVAHVRSMVRRAPDPTDIVSRATAGDPLSDVDFFELGRLAAALEATAAAWDAAGGGAAGRPPTIAPLAGVLAPGRAGGAFYLADAFDPALIPARAAYAAADAEVAGARRQLAESLDPAFQPPAGAEEFIVMRDLMPTVPAGLRVVREAPGYRLLTVELDADALAAVDRREAALAQLGRTEDLVRRALAQEVARYGPAVLAAGRALGELDCTLARVAFTQRWGGCVPELGGRRFAFSAASFVPLRAALSDAGLPYTPISLDLGGAAVLTGPNMGGKSAALATCGFLSACVAAGLPPPAQRAALPLFASVAWVGGEPPLPRERLLSAFGAEVVRTRDALSASPPALVLVDEFARTTGPHEGRALLVALVETLAARGVFALVATHFEGVARAARVPHYSIAGLGPRALDAHAAPDVHAALDALAKAMDYRIVAADGDARSPSDALALAGLLGLDAAVVERAGVLFDAAAGPAASVTE